MNGLRYVLWSLPVMLALIKVEYINHIDVISYVVALDGLDPCIETLI